MEVKLIKKIFLILNKYIPWIIAFGYLINTVLLIFGLEISFIANLIYISLFPLISMLLSSFALNFCTYHRLPLYYIAITNFINELDRLFIIPISNTWMVIGVLILFGITVLTSAYIKNRNNVRKRVVKTNSV